MPALVALCPATQADESVVRGPLTAVDAAARTVTVRPATGAAVTLAVGTGARVEVGGKPAGLDQLKKGQRVRATYVPRDGRNEVVALRPAVATDEQLGREIRQALAAAKSYTFAQKDKYAAELRDAADDVDDRIDQLEAEAKDAGAEAKAKVQARIADLRKRRGVITDRLSKVQSATGDAWEDVKAGAGAALSDLEKALNELGKN
ncbi:hypothetical protein C1280_08660 [Gemmata obscuriglobus]|uniref:DUF5666 domain-containing protein n=1 Tax=Gemmata obscuriglobus TaxID=114 RepID=A0A2Z3GUW9_9BACT|nr:hypothetical protein C1280_08660 [Gemmata obscuriglobus]